MSTSKRVLDENEWGGLKGDVSLEASLHTPSTNQ